MPLTRHQARTNLVSLVQQQIGRPAEHGELLLAVWHDIEDEAQDLHLVEVFECFRAPDGAEQAVMRFPGMSGLWLPGLYFVTLLSRAAFEAEAAAPSSPLAGLRSQLEVGRAEVLFANIPAIAPNTALANWLPTGR